MHEGCCFYYLFGRQKSFADVNGCRWEHKSSKIEHHLGKCMELLYTFKPTWRLIFIRKGNFLDNSCADMHFSDVLCLADFFYRNIWVNYSLVIQIVVSKSILKFWNRIQYSCLDAISRTKSTPWFLEGLSSLHISTDQISDVTNASVKGDMRFRLDAGQCISNEVWRGSDVSELLILQNSLS